MRKIMMLLLLLSGISLVVMACGSPEATIDEPVETASQRPDFTVDAKDVSRIVIHSGGITGEITNVEDIRLFVDYIGRLDDSGGALTDNGYRNIVIHMQDGTEHTLLMGGVRLYYVVDETGWGYVLAPESAMALKELIARVEKEFAESKNKSEKNSTP